MPTRPAFSQICRELPALRKRLQDVRASFLANVVMLSEIPAPTFGEGDRATFLRQRFAESGLLSTSVDEMSNVVGMVPGQGDAEERGTILVVAHLDTHVPATADHTITVSTEDVTGLGVCDNGVGLAVLATLPYLIETLPWSLTSNLLLLGTTRSLGRGNLEGLRFFLRHNRLPCRAGVCLEGVQLGRLSNYSVGMLRGEIRVSVPDAYDWTRFESRGAVALVTEVVRRMQEIPLPRKPRSTIVLGSIEGGTSFNRMATRAVLRFEILSESSRIVREAAKRIEEICLELSADSRAGITMDTIARREPGGIPFSHPLVRRTRAVTRALDIPLQTSPSTSELSILIESGIPSITLGITRGDNVNDAGEYARIEPMDVGLAQILGVLAAIDRGYCDEA